MNKNQEAFKGFMIAVISSVVFFIIGAGAHDIYNGNIKRSVWLEAVKHGYAEEIQTSEGKVFVWKKLTENKKTINP